MLEMIQILDESALLWIQDAVRVPFLDPLVEAFTSLGNTGVMWIVLSLGMLCWNWFPVNSFFPRTPKCRRES